MIKQEYGKLTKLEADLSVSELQQMEKQKARAKLYNKRRDKRDSEPRIKPIKAFVVDEVDEDLIGIDLRRVKSLSDLPID